MSFTSLEYLRHIRAEAAFLVERTHGITKEDFLEDELLRRAFVRSIEIIGEASKKVTEEFRRMHPQLPWRRMAGMRDRVIHDYLGVDYDIVWDVATSRAAELLQEIDRILAETEG